MNVRRGLRVKLWYSATNLSLIYMLWCCLLSISVTNLRKRHDAPPKKGARLKSRQGVKGANVKRNDPFILKLWKRDGAVFQLGNS